MRPPRLLIVLVVILVFAVALPGVVQEGSASPPVVPTSKARQDRDAQLQQGQDQDQPFTPEQLKARNKQRHEALKKDTDKLLELATELKMYVDKTNENMLSVEVVRKADAIEKLARSVREKMKGQ